MKHLLRRGKPFNGADAPTWPYHRFFYAVLCRPALALWKVTLEGRENLPDGPCILAGNHVSYLDPVILWGLFPSTLHVVAKEDLYHHAALAWAFDNAGAVPVKRGSSDREMLRTCAALLKAGEKLAIFPEGTRGRDRAHLGELGAAQDGVAFIALHNDVPIVPVGLENTEKIMPKGARLPRFPRVTVRLGTPLFPADFEGGRRERMTAMTAELMRRIDALRHGADANEAKQR